MVSVDDVAGDRNLGFPPENRVFLVKERVSRREKEEEEKRGKILLMHGCGKSVTSLDPLDASTSS